MTDSPASSVPALADGRFTNLLAVCDGGAGDERTLHLAADVARQCGARLTVMGLVDRPADLSRLAKHVSLDPDAIVQRLIADERERLSKLVSGLAVDSDVAVSSGKPFLEVIRDVIANDRDLVIKAAESWDAAPRSLFTSTDQHLLRKCPAPVWLHMPDKPPEVRSVLAAVDVDFEAAAQPDVLRKLNARTVSTASQVAMLHGATLHVLHAWIAAGESMMWLWSSASDPKEEVDAYLQSVVEQSQENLSRLVEDLPETNLRIRKHSVRGSARDIIPARVSDLDIDILVMGSIARTGIPGFIIGNTAEDVLNRVNCSVVIVKPPGYVSPVKP